MLYEQINQAIKAAMRSKDKVRLSTLRDIKSKIMVEATSASGQEITDAVVLKICMKLHKQRKETYALYLEQGRDDLAKEEFEQADVMIMSKDGLDVLPREYRARCMVIYLDPPRIDRIERLEYRNDPNDSIVRRMNTDDEQFANFRDYDLRVRNADF